MRPYQTKSGTLPLWPFYLIRNVPLCPLCKNENIQPLKKQNTVFLAQNIQINGPESLFEEWKENVSYKNKLAQIKPESNFIYIKKIIKINH